MSASKPYSELISDDPREDASVSEVWAEWKRFHSLSKEHGGLLTTGQAARLLEVSTGQIAGMITRGRMTRFHVLGVNMVPAPEVALFRKQRDSGELPVGGRGHKAVSLSEVLSEVRDGIDTISGK